MATPLAGSASDSNTRTFVPSAGHFGAGAAVSAGIAVKSPGTVLGA